MKETGYRMMQDEMAYERYETVHVVLYLCPCLLLE